MTSPRAMIDTIIECRNFHRQARDWKTADLLRDYLAEFGVELEDRADGTTAWSYRQRGPGCPEAADLAWHWSAA